MKSQIQYYLVTRFNNFSYKYLNISNTTNIPVKREIAGSYSIPSSQNFPCDLNSSKL